MQHTMRAMRDAFAFGHMVNTGNSFILTSHSRSNPEDFPVFSLDETNEIIPPR